MITGDKWSNPSRTLLEFRLYLLSFCYVEALAFLYCASVSPPVHVGIAEFPPEAAGLESHRLAKTLMPSEGETWYWSLILLLLPLHLHNP